MRRKTSSLPPASNNVVDHKSMSDDVDDYSYADVKKNAPFKALDVVFVEWRDTARKAVILSVFIKFQPHRQIYLPRYRVALLTDKGTWSELWQYAYPGDIFRGYQKMSAPTSVRLN